MSWSEFECRGQGSISRCGGAQFVAHGLVDVVLERAPLERRIDRLGGFGEHLVDRLAAIEFEGFVDKLRTVEYRLARWEEELLGRVEFGRLGIDGQPDRQFRRFLWMFAGRQRGERRAAPVGRLRLAGLPLRNWRRAPFARALLGEGGEKDRAPAGGEPGGVAAFVERRVPFGDEAGLGFDRLRVDQLLPVGGEFLGDVAVDLNADLGPVDLERPPAGLPQHRCGPAAVAEGRVGQEDVRRGLVQLDRLVGKFRPGLRDGKVVLLEDVVAIKHGDRAAVPRHCVDFVAVAHLAPGPGGEFALVRVGRRTDVGQRLDLLEAADELKLHVADVGQT